MALLYKLVLVLSLVFGVHHNVVPLPIPQPMVEAMTPVHKEFVPVRFSTSTVLIELTQTDAGHVINTNPMLMNAAQVRAQFFCDNPLAHEGPDGMTPWTFFYSAGYQFTHAAENLAKGYATPQQVETAFMNSPEHEVNIVNSTYTDIGIGWACGVTVVLFGTLT